MREDTPPLLRGPSDDAVEFRRLDQRIDGLKELIAAHDRRYEQRFVDSATAVTAALNAAKEAVIKAEVAAEKRFEGVNEFRATLADQQRTLLPRGEGELRFNAIEQKIDVLTMADKARDAKTMGMGQMWGYIVGATGVLLAVASFLLKIFAKP